MAAKAPGQASAWGTGSFWKAVKMFNLFKRSVAKPVKATVKATARPDVPKAVAETPPVLPEAALPEVQEGNEQTDWALWEDSVMVLDSQMQGLTPSTRIYERVKERPSDYDDIDPFSGIGKNSA